MSKPDESCPFIRQSEAKKKGRGGGVKKKKNADMHTCINPKHLEAAVNMINGLQRDGRRRPARPVLHTGSQSHRVDPLHTLHGDSITSCSLDAADENPPAETETVCSHLGHPAGRHGNYRWRECWDLLSPRRTQISNASVFKWLRFSQTVTTCLLVFCLVKFAKCGINGSKKLNVSCYKWNISFRILIEKLFLTAAGVHNA